MKKLNVTIIGAGIFGLAHAWSAAKRGHRVTVFERSPRAAGASIRNFGMIWPIGQPPGEFYSTALRSRQLWLELRQAADVFVQECGSIHLAHRPDEWNVLQEFAQLGPQLGFHCDLLTPAETRDRSPAANPSGLLGGLFSPMELCVNPLALIRRLPHWLNETFGVEFHFDTTITSIDGLHSVSGDGQRRSFDRCIVCSGVDLKTLYPQQLQVAGLKLCKLQMLRTRPQAGQWRMGPHLASGLTLRHYRCFEVCPGLSQLKKRIADETPELDRYGIHVMASQNDTGHVILGDSHEYDIDVEPFDSARIEELILRELHNILKLPDWSIESRWHGYYCKNSNGPVTAIEPSDGVSVRAGAGGSGMTMAFGLAEKDWENWP